MPESSSGSGCTYRAFISYSHADKAWGDWLHKALETYRVPSRLVGKHTEAGVIPRRLNPVFRDREELSSSPELGSRINEALGKSENLVVICSPASAASRWVNEEVLAYKRMGRGDRIFCLIVAGEPNASEQPPDSVFRHSREGGNPAPLEHRADAQSHWIPDIAARFRDDEQHHGFPRDATGRATEECFCPALRFTLDSNGQLTNERTEPIAADARPGKDGKANAKLKLIAGMLGVGFDALKQRELQRRNRRMTAIAALALVVMAGTSALAIYALISRHRAVVAQHEAVVAKQAAVRRQKQAEDLVDFMLGNLSDKLEQEARLDVMQDVDNHAMAYFQSLPPTDVNDTALAQRAKALAQIGNVRVDVGQLPGALDAYRAATAILAKLAAAEPANVARQVAWSRNLAWVGMIHYQQGKLGDALRDWESARQALQPSLKSAPGNLPLLQQLTYLDADLDHLLAAQGAPEKALGLARERLQWDQRLLKARPGDADYASDLGGAHNELGRLALLRGDLATAIAEYRADDAIETRLSARNPKDNDQREVMLRTRAALGRTLALAGDAETGMRDLQQALDGIRRLSKFDPRDSNAGDLTALYSTQLAALQRQNGDGSEAKTLNDRAVAILTALTRKDPTNHAWSRDYAGALIEQAAQLHAERHADAARASAQSALQILDPLLTQHPNERGTLLATMTARLLLASLTGDPQTARSLREQILRTLRAVRSDGGDTRLLALQAETLLALKRPGDAQPLIRQLWNSGYRDPAFVAVLRRAQIAYPVNPVFRARLLAAAQAGNVGGAPRAAGKQHP